MLFFASLFSTVPLGDGTYKLIPATTSPSDELTTKEFGCTLGGPRHPISSRTVTRWIETGEFKDGEVRRVGKRRFLIRASALPRLRTKWQF
jgi:hypothetical protein